MTKRLWSRRGCTGEAGGAYRRRCANEAGLTLVELLIYVVVASFVMASVYKFMLLQSRGYTDQREVTDARHTVRGAAVLLSWELRPISASDNDLYFVAADSFALRSLMGTAIMCERNMGARHYGLWGISGEIEATADDSVLVFAADGGSATDDAWRALAVEDELPPASASMPTCGWTVAQATERVIKVSHDTSIVKLGAPVRLFRKVQYGIYQDGGRWWLGRKVGAAASYEKLTGPLRPPADGGLVFTFYDATGAATTTATDVRTVDIVLRSESFRKSNLRTPVAERRDSVRIKVFLRGDGG